MTELVKMTLYQEGDSFGFLVTHHGHQVYKSTPTFTKEGALDLGAKAMFWAASQWTPEQLETLRPEERVMLVKDVMPTMDELKEATWAHRS